MSRSKTVNIDHSCGHRASHSIYFYNAQDRDNQISKLERDVCPNCYFAEQGKLAAVTAAEQGLPALEGSEKQISWAETIRQKKLPAILKESESAQKIIDHGRKNIESNHAELIAKYGSDEAINANFDQQAQIFQRAVDFANEANANMTSAKWWIDHR